MTTLLLVEDDDDVRDILTELLRAEGYEVSATFNGAEGLAAMRKRVPDVIVLDVEMPVLSGPEMAVRAMFEDAGMERVPVVLLSGSATLEQVAAKLGTPYWLPKPSSAAEITQLVRRALTERRAPHKSNHDSWA